MFYNDLVKNVVPSDLVKCVVIDEAHKALGKHSYCEVAVIDQFLSPTFINKWNNDLFCIFSVFEYYMKRIKHSEC